MLTAAPTLNSGQTRFNAMIDSKYFLLLPALYFLASCSPQSKSEIKAIQKVDEFSVVKIEPIVFTDIENSDDLFGCNCSFVKDGQWLFSAMDDLGYYKSGGEIIRLKPAPGAKYLPYSAPQNFELADVSVTLIIADGEGIESGPESRDWEGSFKIDKGDQSETMSGTVSCGC